MHQIGGSFFTSQLSAYWMTKLVNDYMVFHVEIGDEKGIQEWVLGDTDPSAAVKSWFATSAKDDDMDQINIDKERKRGQPVAHTAMLGVSKE